MVRTIAAVAALLLVGACSSADPPAGQAATEPAPTASQEPEPLPCVPGAEPFTGPAADEFGPERVMAAYCLLAELVEEQEGTSLALPIPEQKASDVLSVGKVLTPRAGRDWDRQVRARASGEPLATERVNGLTLHDVREVPKGYTRADDGPYVFGTQVGPATAELVPGGGALRLTFGLDTGLVLEKRGDTTGRHSLLPVTRTASYVLVPDGDGWLVEDWEASFEHGPVRLVSG